MNRIIAQIFSVVGHPLLVLTYMLLLLLAVNPFAFGVRDMFDSKAVVLLLSVFGTTFLIPGFGVALMRPLGLIKSLSMPEKQDRTGPYIITGVFYLWLFKNLVSGGGAPQLFAEFVLGATIGLFLDFFINIFTKISAHATGMGGLVAMVLLTALEWNTAGISVPAGGGVLLLGIQVLLALAVVFAGLVGASRLALNAHVPTELYLGYGVGFGAVWVAHVLV